LILVTIGSSLPFDRLVRKVDELASRWPGEQFFAQIGAGRYEPRNMRFARMLPAVEFSDALKSSRLAIAHAGMGTVISALEAGTPIVIFPRRAAFGEVTTDHQVATARWLCEKAGVHVAFEEEALCAAIERGLADGLPGSTVPRNAPAALLDKIRSFINQASRAT